jgi:hypothetical protein
MKVMKKNILLLSIIALTGCATSIEKQCDPEKNYIISNPELMEKYKEEFKNGEIKSLYYDFSELSANKGKICKNSSCVNYDYKRLSFTEKKFNNLDRNGIYSIYIHPKGNKRCNFWTYSWDKVCYESIKNENNDIKSKYAVIMYTENDATILEFKNLKDNKLIYKYSHTIYTTGAISGAGFGSCGVKQNNNPEYKFNPIAFIENPFNIPYKF